MNREQWLTIAATRIRSTLRVEAPENMRFSVGFPPASARRRRAAAPSSEWAGMYSLHRATESAGGMREAFIAPTLDAPHAMAAVYAAMVEAATTVRPSTVSQARMMVGNISMPPFPHDAMVAPAGTVGPDGAPVAAPVQSTRMIKAACPVCGYTIRLTRRWIAVGLPACPVDAVPFQCDSVSTSVTE